MFSRKSYLDVRLLINSMICMRWLKRFGNNSGKSKSCSSIHTSMQLHVNEGHFTSWILVAIALSLCISQNNSGLNKTALAGVLGARFWKYWTTLPKSLSPMLSLPSKRMRHSNKPGSATPYHKSPCPDLLWYIPQ